MATIEILSGDFERETTRIRYSEAGRAFLRLRSTDGPIEDLFLESEVVGAAEAGDGGGSWARAARAGERDKRLFVVLLRGGRKFVARGDFDAFLQCECAALPADLRRERLSHPHGGPAAVAEARFGSWFGASLFSRLLPGGR
ncbi:MAG: hypothetical protein LWW93_11490 [Hyphomicrobiales bacterium]|nr:hypothetical protein [Hyphomicrobiales bacterium]